MVEVDRIMTQFKGMAKNTDLNILMEIGVSGELKSKFFIHNS